MLSNHCVLCHPLLIFRSVRVFSNESALNIRWPKYWSFRFSISLRPMNIQAWFPLGLTGFTSLQSKGLSRVFSSTTIQKHQFFGFQPFLWSSSYMIHYTTTGKTIALTIQTFVDKVIFLLFNMLSRVFTAFLPRSKHLSISWLQSPSAVIFEPKKINSVTVSIAFPSICHEVMGLDAMIFVFWTLGFKLVFSLSSFKRLFTVILDALCVFVCVCEREILGLQLLGFCLFVCLFLLHLLIFSVMWTDLFNFPVIFGYLVCVFVCVWYRFLVCSYYEVHL